MWKRGKTTRESLSTDAGEVCFLAKLPLIRGRVCGFSARHRGLVLPITTFDDEAVFSCSSVNWFFEESFNSSSRSSFSEASVEPKAGTLVDMAETSPISSSFQEPQVDENANSPVNTDHEDQTDAPAVKGLNESRTELFTRVQNLKKDLQEWRGKLDTQVKTYREELGELRSTLNTEVEQLRVEFQELRNTLKKQLEITSGLARLEPDSLPSNNEHPATAL